MKRNRCVFLSEDKRCVIYPFRPLLCRLYPFQLHIKWDGRILWCLEHCPGVNRSGPDSVDDGTLEGLINQILELEGGAFLENLRDYVLRVKRPVTPLFGTPLGFVFSNWSTKERLFGILWEIFHQEVLEVLTPRARLECIRCDILPQFQNSLVSKVVRGQPPMLFYMEEDQLLQEYEPFKKRLPGLARQSAEVEAIHQRDLEEKGRLVYGSSEGKKLNCSRDHTVKVHRLNGEGVDVEVERLMRSLPLTLDALMEEERYIKELVRREGRYGKEIIDLPFDLEVYTLRMIADALELKANAFAIHGGKNCIGMEEMRESTWVVERALVGILYDSISHDRTSEGGALARENKPDVLWRCSKTSSFPE